MTTGRIRPGRYSALAFVLAGLFVLGACRTPDSVDSRAEIVAVLEQLPSAWNARDAGQWVSNFDAASGFTNILGMHFEDRDANQARHAELFSTIFSESQLSAEVLDVRVLGGDAAVAELQFTLVGYTRLPPGVTESRPDVLMTRLICMLERRGDRWVIVAAQNTAILPIAMPAGA